ncbi:hypothetical protein ACFWG5_34275 [Streptomyces hydrogenans]|uniref:hypothetical protein n=1 Tax=Streptomyces TaxID=1883 RepID=UPI00363D3153
MNAADRELLTALLDMDEAAYVIDLHDDDCDNLHCPGCATDTENATPAMRTPQTRQQEDPHDGPLHTTYAVCRDLPERTHPA